MIYFLILSVQGEKHSKSGININKIFYVKIFKSISLCNHSKIIVASYIYFSFQTAQIRYVFYNQGQLQFLPISCQ